MKRQSTIGLLLLLFTLSLATHAVEKDEFKIKREMVFEFAQKPVFTRNGDKTTISFETKGFCDVTIAIENNEGRILRHLVSGVLGDNAPEPFQKNSKKQTIVWDGKNDQGQYLDDKNAVNIRVSLGLKPQYEKTLFWDPRKRSSNGWGGANAVLVKAAPEGVYLYETGAMDHVRLFDHEGNYVRTVYPFPSDKLDKVEGLTTHTFPHDGKTLPWKTGFQQATLLFGKNAMAMANREETGFNATCMAVNGNRIALAGKYVSHLGTDGSSGGLNLAGQKVIQPIRKQGMNADGAEGKYFALPCSAALSPDGKSLYLTGFMWRLGWHNDVFNGVQRVSMVQDTPPELFAGSMKQDESGTEDGKFRSATSVACDAQGRVYVTDFMNDRIQVFSPDGKFLKAIAVSRPALVNVSPKNGEIYCFSWVVNNRFILKLHAEREKAQKPPLNIEPKLLRLGTFDNPKETASYPLPLPLFKGMYYEWHNLPPIQNVAEVDFHTEPPTIWLSQATNESFKGDWENLGMLLFKEKDGKLVKVKDFGKEAQQALVRPRPAILDRQRLYMNPKNEKLYVGEADSGVGKSFGELVEIDPVTGAIQIVKLPFAAEDIAFDTEGFIYLRSDKTVVRYDPVTWREIPWDYGDDRNDVAFDGPSPKVASALMTPSHRSPSFWHMGGIYVNPQGFIAVTCPNNTETIELVPGEKGKEITNKGKGYTPQVYPGRLQWGEIHIWDKHGNLVAQDAFPGVGHMNGIGIDNNRNIFVMANGTRLLDGKPYDPNAPDDLSETVMKVKPQAARVLSGNGGISVPLAKGEEPKRPADFNGFPTGRSWVEGAEWFYGGVGYTGNAGWDGGGCRCFNARFCIDYFARSFAPETRHYSVAVLDSSGNLITRVGQYGNVDDGKPLDGKGGPPNPRSIGGDETGIFHAAYVGTHSDRRLFISDAGNARIVSVKMNYHTEEKIALKDVPSQDVSVK